jgi:rhodanese-related sulfurtransferase
MCFGAKLSFENFSGLFAYMALPIFFFFFSFFFFPFRYDGFAQDISPKQLKKMIEERKEGKINFVLIDVRTKEEFESGYIPGTDLNIPHDEIGEKIGQLNIKKDDTIILYCRSGRRSEIAKQELIKRGYKKVLNAGGIKHWIESGFELKK